jgi:aconitate decarboxylase
VFAVKPYAAMAGLHAAIDAARELRADGPVDPGRVESIVISVSEAAFHHGGWRAARPLTVVGAQMNLAYAVAVTLIDGTALAEQFSPGRIASDDVWALIERTTARDEPGFDRRLEDGYNTRLQIKLTDGTTRSSFVEHPRGGLREPLSNAEIVEKYRQLVAPLLEPRRAAAIERLVLGVDELAGVEQLVDLLAAPVRRESGAQR